MTEHTPTPWEYRPARHDDWGWIRGPKGADGIAPLVATARSGKWEPEAMLDEHRINKTDPYGPNALFIVKAVNNHDALVKALEEAKAALFKIRACSIVGCEQGYGHPEKWADALFASHADVAAALKTIDGLLAHVGQVKQP
jgi:hypothetical protein